MGKIMDVTIKHEVYSSLKSSMYIIIKMRTKPLNMMVELARMGI